MAKTDQESYKTLRALEAIARTILDLQETFEAGLGLKATIAALESRKAALSAEVADLLKSNEAARTEARTLRADLDIMRKEFAETRQTEADALADERTQRAKIAADQAQAVKAQHEALVKHLRDERAKLDADNKLLADQKSTLLTEIDGLLEKYARR